MLNGIDISNWQGGLNVSAVPCDFVICKATEGTGYVDQCCNGFIQQAKACGKLYGFYHFARNNDPIVEADFFVDNTINYFGEGIPVLDYEADAVANGVGWVEAWMNRVHERTGVWPLFYSYQNHLANTDYSCIRDKCGLWVAWYANYNTTDYGYPSNYNFSLGSWPTATIWQYSSCGRLPGWGGNLDLNHAYVDADAWRRIAKGDTAEKARIHNLQIWDYNGGTNQLFWVRKMGDWEIGDDNHRFIPIAIRCCANWDWISLPNTSQEACPAELWGGDDNGEPRPPQELVLEQISYAFKIHPVGAMHLSLDVNGASSASGTQVQWWPNNDTPAQLWTLLPQENESYALVSACGAKVLDLPNGGILP